MRHTIRLALVASVAVNICSAQEPASGSDFDVYAGTYVLTGGDTLIVAASGDGLVIEMPHGNLFRFSDHRADSRVIAIEHKTRQLMDSMIRGDRSRMAELIGASPGPMEEYIESTLDIISPAFAANATASRYEISATVYRDEDSDYGFEDEGWGWQTFVRFFGHSEDVVVRIVWDGGTGFLMHRGIGGTPPAATRLSFRPRKPARSWIRAYDPDTQTIKRLREVDRSNRVAMTPARFVAYDVETHQTIGVRFRRDILDDRMRIETGPLGSQILVAGFRERP